MIAEAAVLLIVIALVVQPILQRRRERAVLKQMQETRDAVEAKAAIDCAIQQNQDKAKLPNKWDDSYRFWLK